MLRFAANVVFILCLVVWCSFVLVICMSVIEHGIGGITPELIHLFGRTNQLGVLSSSIMIWRMFGLLLVTLLTAYARRSPCLSR
jgi:hypothetical protein